ncbi:MAG TPA: translation initiation factor IF-3 [Bacilli bacterium]|nr:translation initiation factor IF-3 [Bacilli bacterium]
MSNRYDRRRPNRPVELVNDKIPFPEVRVIGPDGQQLGIMKTREAVDLATFEYELDLFCVNPNGKPPVCRMMNYSKYRFEQQKRAREQRQRQKTIELKEIRLTPSIQQHDLETKARKAIEFLKAGDKVKVSVRYRGRQMAHIDVGERTLERFIEFCSEYGTAEKKASLDNRVLSTVLASKVKK